ncbi:DUF4401 domain-containing protein [Niabella sp. 22666]|uniref:DUF4401 domain-containing protein n=1 Tax=Niabella sp. 22666 TaxID=3453954 RepID=UPI003F85AB8F
MKNKEQIETLLAHMADGDEQIQYDVDKITAVYEKNDHGHQSIAVKILSVVGGILASLAFIGFLFLVGLYESEIGLFFLGAVGIIGSALLSKKADSIITDTICVSFFIIGFVLLGIGLDKMQVDADVIFTVFAIVAFGALVLVQTYILSFVSLLIVNGSILTLILSNHQYNLVNVYVIAIALVMAYFFLKEAVIITGSKILSKLYNPLRTGLIFSFLAGLVLVGKNGLVPTYFNYNWVCSAVIIAAIVYVVFQLFEVLNITKRQHKIVISVFAVLVLLPTLSSPAISGAILIILLSFLINDKTGLVLGMLAFIYFISQYYYDLNLTLLIKSILMFSSGILFIIIYLFTHKKLTTHD